MIQKQKKYHLHHDFLSSMEHKRRRGHSFTENKSGSDLG